MTALDTAKTVCAKASLCDPRFPKPDIAIAVQWSEILGDINQTDALAVVRDYYSQPRDRVIQPGDVLAGIRKIRTDRIRNADSSLFDDPTVDPDDITACNAARRARIDAIADGQAITREPVTQARDVGRLLADTARRMPSIPSAKPRTELDRKLAGQHAPVNRPDTTQPVEPAGSVS